MAKKIENVIYILTNPQYPGYVKIGYASDLKQRISSLNTGVLVSFSPYAVYETSLQNADVEIHAIIRLLNPILRASKFEKGKVQGKEFFKLEPEEAFELFKHIAKVSGTESKAYRVTADYKPIPPENPLKDATVDIEEDKEEKHGKPDVVIVREPKHPKSPVRFSKCGIPVGAQLVYTEDNSVVVTVVSDRKVEYNGEVTSLSCVVKKLKGLTVVQGTLFFTYNGRSLVEIAKETQWKE